MAKASRNLNIAVIGDSWVGKTSLIKTFIHNKYDPDFVEEAAGEYGERRYAATVTVKNKEYNLTVLDIAGGESYRELRQLSYADTDCFVLCYSINRWSSYENAEKVWWPEIKNFSDTVPIVLVGIDIDKLVCNQNKFVTTGDGRSLSTKIRAYKMVECSADKNIKLDKVFKKAVRAAKIGRKKRHRRCISL